MSYLSLFICREKGVRRGSLRNERTRFAPFSVTTKVNGKLMPDPRDGKFGKMPHYSPGGGMGTAGID